MAVAKMHYFSRSWAQSKFCINILLCSFLWNTTSPSGSATIPVPSSSIFPSSTLPPSPPSTRCTPISNILQICRELPGRGTIHAQSNALELMNTVSDSTIQGAKFLAENNDPPVPAECVDLLIHIFCLAVAPPCNPETALPMLICERSCNIYRRVRVQKFCSGIDKHLHLVSMITTNNDFDILFDAFFNFNCTDPSTYLFKNVTLTDADLCTSLSSPQSEDSLSNKLCELGDGPGCSTASTLTLKADDGTFLLKVSIPPALLVFLVFIFVIFSCSCFFVYRKRHSQQFLIHEAERRRKHSGQALIDEEREKGVPLSDWESLGGPNFNDSADREEGIASNYKKIFSRIVIPYKALHIGACIGQGAFGKVFKGEYNLENGVQDVAIKTLKSNQLEEFFAESVIMKDFSHPNVLGLVGVVFDALDSVPRLVLPFMENGNLKNYLKAKRKEEVSNVSSLPQDLKLSNIVKMCIDIAKGMEYLAKHLFVHRDLAARNCMVSKDLLVKVGDFGLARDVYSSDYYRASSKFARLPVKWMPLETFNDKISNEKTDVWSYGVTCWEVFSLGRAPYPTVENSEIFSYISRGARLEKPALCPNPIFEIMGSCWELKPEDRPTFKQITESVADYWDEEFRYFNESMILS